MAQAETEPTRVDDPVQERVAQLLEGMRAVPEQGSDARAMLERLPPDLVRIVSQLDVDGDVQRALVKVALCEG